WACVLLAHEHSADVPIRHGIRALELAGLQVYGHLRRVQRNAGAESTEHADQVRRPVLQIRAVRGPDLIDGYNAVHVDERPNAMELGRRHADDRHGGTVDGDVALDDS